MKNLLFFSLLIFSFTAKSQEPAKSKAPPSSNKSLNENGVSSAKGRGIHLESAKTTSATPASTNTVTTEENKTNESSQPKTEQVKPQSSTKKDMNKEGTTKKAELVNDIDKKADPKR